MLAPLHYGPLYWGFWVLSGHAFPRQESGVLFDLHCLVRTVTVLEPGLLYSIVASMYYNMSGTAAVLPAQKFWVSVPSHQSAYLWMTRSSRALCTLGCRYAITPMMPVRLRTGRDCLQRRNNRLCTRSASQGGRMPVRTAYCTHLIITLCHCGSARRVI